MPAAGTLHNTPNTPNPSGFMRSLSNLTNKEIRPDYVDLHKERYLQSEGASQFIRDEGLFVMPVIGPEGSAPVVIRTHAPIGYRRGTYKAVKSKGPPLFPAQADTLSGDIILNSSISFPTPQEGLNMDLVYGVDCDYWYCQALPRGTEDSFPINSHAFASLVDALGVIPLNALTKNNQIVPDNTWNSPLVDSKEMQAYKIFM